MAVYTQASAALLPTECNILLGYITFNVCLRVFVLLLKVERLIIVLFFNIK